MSRRPGSEQSESVLGVIPTLARLGQCDDRSVSGSVLIVDDDPRFRRLAKRILTSAGLTVVAEAADAQAAVIAANASKPDGILVDVGLPDRDGLDLARELLALEWRPRVLLTSTDPEAADPVEGRGDVLPFLPKEDLPNAPLRALLGPTRR
jgi:CheY-like chemotaxis protein